MSIASISNAFVSRVRAGEVHSTTAPVEATQAVKPDGRGRRHELVDAMAGVLGIENPDRRTEQAVFKFAHALMHDLRSVAAPQDAVPGGGKAWGRQGWSDLGARIDALATAVAGAGDDATQELPATPVAPVTGDGAVACETATDAAATSVLAATATSTPTTAADGPAAGDLAPPQPLTQTSAALWLSQVPSTRLLEAFATLSQALPTGGDAEGDARPALADFLDRLSAAIQPTAVAEPSAGSLFHATA